MEIPKYHLDPSEVIVIAADSSKIRILLPTSDREADILFLITCICQSVTFTNGIMKKKAFVGFAACRG